MKFPQKQFGLGKTIVNRIKMPISMTETLYDLRKRGYPFKFMREADSFYCAELDSWFPSDSFTIDECYHFEHLNESNDRMLYAISSSFGPKGVLIDTYYTYTDSLSIELLERYGSQYHLTTTL